MALRQEELASLRDDVDLERDRALVARCQEGDPAAFGNLYARYYERLLRFCQRRLTDRHEAEDAAQEAFARAWKALPHFAGERRFYPWLTVIAGNICTDTLRRRSRNTPTDDLELASLGPGAGGAETSEEHLLAAADGKMVHQALDRLSVRHRHVLALREGSGLTYQQIADHEGVEVGTVETLLWRARQALKREFNVLSDAKGAMAGFLFGAGALLRRGLWRAAQRTSDLPSGGGAPLRNALTGVAATSAAVAAVVMIPPALSTPQTHPAGALSGPAGVVSGREVPAFGSGTPTGTTARGTTVRPLVPAGSATTATASDGTATATRATGAVTSAADPLLDPGTAGTTGLPQVAGAVGSTVTNLANPVTALAQALLGSGGSGAAGSASPGLGAVVPALGDAVSTVTTPVSGLVGSVTTAAGGAVTAATGALGSVLGATTSGTTSSGQPTGSGLTAPLTGTLKIPLG